MDERKPRQVVQTGSRGQDECRRFKRGRRYRHRARRGHSARLPVFRVGHERLRHRDDADAGRRRELPGAQSARIPRAGLLRGDIAGVPAVVPVPGARRRAHAKHERPGGPREGLVILSHFFG